MTLPRGHGMFVRSWRVTREVSSPRTFASVYRGAGFSFASPVVLAGNTRAKLRERAYWDAARAAGIEMHPCWVLPEPTSGLDDICARLCEAMAALGALSLIIDPELEFKGKRAQARTFARIVRRRTREHGLKAGFTSYSLPVAHPDFPWSEFAAESDFAFAQTYDRENQFRADYFATAVAQYNAKGFARAFPCYGLNDHRRGTTKRAVDLRRHLALIPTDAPAVCGWGPVTVPVATMRILAAWNAGAVSVASGAKGGALLALLMAIGGLAALKG